MRHDDHCPVCQAAQVPQQGFFRFCVQSAGGFIQQQHRPPGKDCPRDGQPLHLAFGQACAAFAQLRIRALLQPGNEFLRAGGPQRPPQAFFIPGMCRIREGDNVPDGSVQQCVSLGNIGEKPAPARGQRLPVHGDFPAVRRIHAQQQLKHGGFPAAAVAAESDGFTLPDFQRQVFQDLLPIFPGIAEADVPEAKAAESVVVVVPDLCR